MPFHVGLDGGGESHAICVIDAAGAIVARFAASHDAAGLADLFARLRRIAAPAELPVAIGSTYTSNPSGLIVDALVDAGHPVIPIHPNILKACRPRYRAAGGKSDPGDAFLLADILRTDGHRCRPLRPASAETRALRALPDGCWPGATALFADIQSPIALAFLRRYTTPDSASRLGEKRLARLRAAPNGLASEPEAEARGELARTLAELGDVRERFPTENQLAAEAGVAPVTHASGKTRGVAFRWGLQQEPPRRHHNLRRQLPTRLRMGRQRPPPCPRARMQASPRGPHPRPRPGPRPPAGLAGPPPLRSRPASRRAKPRRPTHTGWTQGVSRQGRRPPRHGRATTRRSVPPAQRWPG